MLVIRRFAIGAVLFFLAFPSVTLLGGSPERAAMKHIRKKHWEKAEKQLRKVLRKDSTNALGRYVFAHYFFKQDNPSYNLDSAYQYAIRSLTDYQVALSKEREKLKRFPLDSMAIVTLRARIDSASFEYIKTVNTEEAYIRFLVEHPLASQQKEAMDLRDEVAYLNAASINTYESFLEFLNKYPNASKAPEARKKYDRLLYETRTKDKRLVSYENFLREYPKTPFRKEIEQNIFELFTLSGEVERYLSFLQLYPNSSMTKRAHDLLFHILQEKEDPPLPGLFLTDSLQNIQRLQENYMVPFSKGKKFGFMDKNGITIIQPLITQLSDVYKCGNITEDIIVLPDRILARDGNVVFSGAVDEVDDLGAGFLKLKVNGCNRIIHKSGVMLDSCATDAKISGNRFLSILKGDQWFIYALTGRKLSPTGWDDLIMASNILCLKKDSRWHIFTPAQLVAMAEKPETMPTEAFDEIKVLPGGLIWVKSNEYEGIRNQSLEDVIALNKHNLTTTFFGFIGHSLEGFSIYDRQGKQSSYFDKVKLHEPWVTVNKSGVSYLFDPQLQEFHSVGYDSIKFEGAFAIGVKADTIAVHFNDQTMLEFVQPVTTQFLPGKDSTSFITIGTTETVPSRKGKKGVEEKKTIYNRRGQKLFTAVFDQVQYAGQDLFIIAVKEKKGLINSSGKMVLPVEYDAIGSVTNNVVSLLKAMKFGLYDVLQNKLIKPQYDKNLIPYTDKVIAAFNEGLYGFINWDNKSNGKHAFDEIRYWNDTTALVKKNQLWMLYNIDSKQELLTNIKDIKMIRDTPDEKLAIVQQDAAYGVLSNKRGTVIPLTFSDLVNIGSSEEPLYFTEKHVSEAAVFVVIYYDKNGRFLRKEVYEESEDYEKIYCPDN